MFFPKIFERFLSGQMVPYLNSILSVFISAYRNNYSCQHVLLRMIEIWRRCLHENKVVGPILIDLSKAFDSLPHDLLIAKLHAYGFSHNALKLLLSYLSGRMQCVKNNNTVSLFKLILSVVPQGSIVGPILFNVFINNLYMPLNSNIGANILVDSLPNPTSPGKIQLVLLNRIRSKIYTDNICQESTLYLCFLC